MHAAAFLSHWLPGGGCGLQLWSQSTMLHSSLLLPVALAAAGRGAALRRRAAHGAGALSSHSSPFRFEPSELFQCQSQSRMPFPQLSLLLRSCDSGDCLLTAVPSFGMKLVTVIPGCCHTVPESSYGVRFNYETTHHAKGDMQAILVRYLMRVVDHDWTAVHEASSNSARLPASTVWSACWRHRRVR